MRRSSGPPSGACGAHRSTDQFGGEAGSGAWIGTGRGGIDLLLTREQYAKLKVGGRSIELLPNQFFYGTHDDGW
jgi:hypothetical protein